MRISCVIGEICPVFRKHFSAFPGATAALEITAFGVYEAFLNGQRIGNFFLAPGWTSYPTRLQVQTYALTALLREENELTVTLGKGWFAGRISAGVYQALADGPRLLAALHLTGADGTREYATDESWQWAESPIRFSDIYDGETYDARVTPENWRFCRTDTCGKQMLIPQEGEIVTEHERLGWTGDAQASIRAIACTFDGKRFFAKWLRDMAAEQRGDGAVSHFVPNVGLFTKDPALFCGGSAWADAAVICPWQLYQAYGDKALLREHLPMMQKWVEYVRRTAGDSCIWSTGHHYGDWLALDAGEGNYTGASRKEFIATAFYAHSVQLLAQAMDALDMDGAAHHRLFEAIRAAHRNAFPDCRTQTECALALHFGLAANPDRVAAQLAELVRSNGNRLTTGFVGTPYLLHALSENGYAQTAYDLLLQTEAPSWLFSVKMGATTVWEHWDSRKADGSFWSTDMNSFNHHAYGAVADWLYAAAGGIRPGKPGYETVLLAPVPDRRLQSFEAELHTPHGICKSAWTWQIVKPQLHVMLRAGFCQFCNQVAAKRRTGHAVVTVIFCAEKRKALMVLGGHNDVLHTRLLRKLHPIVSTE